MNLADMVPEKLRKVSNEELKLAWLRLHQWYAVAKEQGRAIEPYVNAAQFVLAEMKTRGMNYDKNSPLVQEIMKLQKNLNLDELPETIILVPEFIDIVGSAIEKQNGANDVDILVRALLQDRWYLLDSQNVKLPLRKVLDKEKTGKLHWVDSPTGPHADYLPLYHLALVRCNSGVKRINKFNPLETFVPSKPQMKEVTEYFNVDELWDGWVKEKITETNIVAELKIDGFRCVVVKVGDEVKVWFEGEKKNKADFIPQLVEVFKKVPDDFVLDGELQAELNGKIVPRTQMMHVLTRPLEPDLTPIYHAFDCLYFNNNITDLPLKQRKQYLEAVVKQANSYMVKLIRSIPIKNKIDLQIAARWAAQQEGAEGLVLKDVNSTYKEGGTSDWAKLKFVIELKVKVLEKIKTKNGYSYRCGLLGKGYYNSVEHDGEWYVDLGKTFVTQQDIAEETDIITVRIEELLTNSKDGLPVLSWGKPTVVGVDATRDKPYTAEQAIKLAKRIGVLKENVEKFSEDDEETRAEVAEKFWQEHWHELYPTTGEGRFIYHYHFRGLTEEELDLGVEQLLDKGHSVHGDLRFEQDDGLWGFTLFLGAAEDVKKADPLVNHQKVRGTFKLLQPKSWLTVGLEEPYISEPGAVGATSRKYAKFFAVDYGTYQIGVWREHMIEVFLHGNKLKGRLVFQYAPVGKQRIWLASMPVDQAPYAEKNELKAVLDELKEKGQKWLIWCKPGEKPNKIDVQSGLIVKSFDYKIIKSAEKKIVYGIVLEPNAVDAHGDVVDENAIEEAAHYFMLESGVIGIEHSNRANAKVVESYVAPQDIEIEDVKVKKGG